MHLKKFFREWRMVRKNRKNYRIKWVWEFHVADDPFIFYIIPSIVYVPWHQLIPDCSWDNMFTFAWLNMAITLGRLETVRHNNDFA